MVILPWADGPRYPAHISMSVTARYILYCTRYGSCSKPRLLSLTKQGPKTVNAGTVPNFGASWIIRLMLPASAYRGMRMAGYGHTWRPPAGRRYLQVLGSISMSSSLHDDPTQITYQHLSGLSKHNIMILCAVYIGLCWYRKTLIATKDAPYGTPTIDKAIEYGNAALEVPHLCTVADIAACSHFDLIKRSVTANEEGE